MWNIETTDVFDKWFEALDDVDKENVLASLLLLQQKGPQLPRPYADTVKASKFMNMKELRTQSKGNPIRSFYAFDPQRTGILLCAGEKTGKEKRFYEKMIAVADHELEKHLTQLNLRGE